MASPRSALWAAIAVLALAAPLMPAGHAAAQDSESWTVMVYMSGDSSLAEQMPQDLAEMKEVGSGDGLEVIVLADSSSVGDTRLLRILEHGEEAIPLADVDPLWGDELNLGAPEVLVDFVKWAAASYPADRYMLDLWGHGSGWTGVCPDKGNYLDTVEVGRAMAEIEAAGIGIDIVSMDACQMGSAEMAYEMRGLAGYALLSQKDVPLSGWPYDSFLGVLKGNGTVEHKCAAMADAYVEWGPVHSLYSVTMSVIDLGEMGALAAPLKAYSEAVSSMAGYFNPQLIAAREATEEYDGDSQYDLAHLLANVNTATGCRHLEALSGPALERLDACVAYERHWTNTLDEPADNAHGLSIWFPEHDAGIDYLATDFANDTGWPGFLAAMSPYFQQRGRLQAVYQSSILPDDGDGDGLLDSAKVHLGDPGNGTVQYALYGPGGNLSSGASMQTGGNLTEQLSEVGFYDAEVLLWDWQGRLVNCTAYRGALAREEMRTVSGSVVSETGKELRWVTVTLFDSSGTPIASAVTDSAGRYSMDVIVPTQTNGTALELACGLGPERVNATVGELALSNVYDFTLGTGEAYAIWMVWAAAALEAAAAVLLSGWAMSSRRRRGEGQQQAGENVIEQQQIPPQ